MKPGQQITLKRIDMRTAIYAAVKTFEDETGVTVQSVHYYVSEPNPKLLNDKGKQAVDIMLKL